MSGKQSGGKSGPPPKRGSRVNLEKNKSMAQWMLSQSLCPSDQAAPGTSTQGGLTSQTSPLPAQLAPGSPGNTALPGQFLRGSVPSTSAQSLGRPASHMDSLLSFRDPGRQCISEGVLLGAGPTLSSWEEMTLLGGSASSPFLGRTHNTAQQSALSSAGSTARQAQWVSQSAPPRTHMPAVSDLSPRQALLLALLQRQRPSSPLSQGSHQPSALAGLQQRLTQSPATLTQSSPLQTGLQPYDSMVKWAGRRAWSPGTSLRAPNMELLLRRRRRIAQLIQERAAAGAVASPAPRPEQVSSGPGYTDVTPDKGEFRLLGAATSQPAAPTFQKGSAYSDPSRMFSSGALLPATVPATVPSTVLSAAPSRVLQEGCVSSELDFTRDPSLQPSSPVGSSGLAAAALPELESLASFSASFLLHRNTSAALPSISPSQRQAPSAEPNSDGPNNASELMRIACARSPPASTTTPSEQQDASLTSLLAALSPAQKAGIFQSLSARLAEGKGGSELQALEASALSSGSSMVSGPDPAWLRTVTGLGDACLESNQSMALTGLGEPVEQEAVLAQGSMPGSISTQASLLGSVPSSLTAPGGCFSGAALGTQSVNLEESSRSGLLTSADGWQGLSGVELCGEPSPLESYGPSPMASGQGHPLPWVDSMEGQGRGFLEEVNEQEGRKRRKVGIQGQGAVISEQVQAGAHVVGLRQMPPNGADDVGLLADDRLLQASLEGLSHTNIDGIGGGSSLPVMGELVTPPVMGEGSGQRVTEGGLVGTEVGCEVDAGLLLDEVSNLDGIAGDWGSMGFY